MKKPAFPNSEFKTQEEYFKFTDKYHVYGSEAYKLRKQQMKSNKNSTQ